MENILNTLRERVEIGKVNTDSPFPPDLKGEKGADELTKEALDAGISPKEILDEALIKAMGNVGLKFSEGKIFVPEMLMSAQAMKAAMKHLKPFFESGEVESKGTFVIATIFGDLHDIGKNLVAMVVEGSGWNVVDLGVDVSTEKLLASIEENPGCYLGLSALLTTTMVNIGSAVKEIKAKHPNQKILVGGAPLTKEYCEEIGADFYSADPQGAVDYLAREMA
jgi:5-methyltetrahydrofolate--homocysteine methyltransferase